MRQINLLPSELKPSKQIGLLVKKAEKFFIILLVIYLIILGAGFSLKYFYDKKLSEYNERKSVLSNELKSLVNVETATVYIRDRVEKYKKLSNKDIELTNLKLFEESHSYFPADSMISSIQIAENNISYSVSVTNLYSLSRFLEGLIESGLYKEVVLSGLSYTADKGYSFNLAMSF